MSLVTQTSTLPAASERAISARPPEGSKFCNHTNALARIMAHSPHRSTISITSARSGTVLRASFVAGAMATIVWLSSCNRRDSAAEDTTISPMASSNRTSFGVSQMLPPPPATAFSLIELIGNPERFHNGRVSLGGFLSAHEPEHDKSHGYLYLGREDYEVGLQNLVKIQVEQCAEPQAPDEVVSFDRVKELSLQYVFVKGFFTQPRGSSSKGIRRPLDFGTICATSMFPIQQRRKTPTTP